MKFILKNIIWFVFLILVIGNVYAFISGMGLAIEINYFEKQTKELHEKNIELEKEMSSFNSYQYAASMAAELDFSKTIMPIYLDNPKYALNR